MSTIGMIFMGFLILSAFVLVMFALEPVIESARLKIKNREQEWEKIHNGK